jgi:hypothetical protein
LKHQGITAQRVIGRLLAFCRGDGTIIGAGDLTSHFLPV